MNSRTDSVATLLLVDDEPGVLSSLRRLLRPAGYQIHTAESGKAGLEILEREVIDLVISDMRMPVMDGAAFLEQVRLRWPFTTRILLTGYADVRSTMDAINRGEIFRYVAKPWDDNDLMLIVRDALEARRLQSENARLQMLTQVQNVELLELNASLEDKVMLRTAEIEQINSRLNLANDKLENNFLVSIKLFSGLMELRGGAMAGHSRRVAELAQRLAARLGASPMDQKSIFFAALLHDVGKIGFSDSLLGKPLSCMSGDEIARYRKHTVASESALMPLDGLKDAAKIVRSHHERFDGQGFPDGLQGSNIVLGARILAVVNDYDGLQIGTLAEKHMSIEESKSLLLQSRGKRYDPQVVDVFIELLGGLSIEVLDEVELSHLDLAVGMVLARDLVSREGALLLAVDIVLDALLIRQIQDYAARENQSVSVYVRT